MGSKASSSLWKEYNALYQKQNLRQQENDKRINYRFIVNAEKKYMHGKARKLLDVGFGSGILMGMLNKRYDVTGIDKDPKSLSAAKKQYPGLRVFKADMRNFRLKDKFDIITCVCAIDHGDDLRDDFSKTLKSMHTHLNGKGMIIFDMPFIYDTWGNESSMVVRSIKTAGRKTIQYISVYKKEKGTKPHQGMGYAVTIKIKGKRIIHEAGKPYLVNNLLTIKQVKEAAMKNKMKCYVYDGWSGRITDKPKSAPVFVLVKR